MSTAAPSLFKAASVLTEPVCKTRELYYQFKWIATLEPDLEKIQKIAKECLLVIGIILCAAGALIVTLPAIALRGIATRLQGTPYMHMKGEGEEKPALENHTFTLFSWNICCVPAGYSLTDGGVAPWRGRIDHIINKIKEQNADVVTLCEVMDYEAALCLIAGLRQDYAHFYFNIGAQGFGPNSGLFVASKFPLTNPRFIRFGRDTLVGRTKSAAKGLFSVQLPSGTCLYSTHLQHSEIPSAPTLEEVAARNAQREVILNKINENSSVLTGDFNLDTTEFNKNWVQKFNHAEHFEENPTWGGDGLCARLMDKKPSPPCNLDYTVGFLNTIHSIQTVQVETQYDEQRYLPGALSDHKGLLSTIVIQQNVN